MPGYSLASVDQLSLGGFFPDVLASVFVALGLRRTSFLRMEAEGVEVAEVPLDVFQETLAAACRAPTGILRNGGGSRSAQLAVQEGFNILAQQRAGSGGTPDVSLSLLRRVFYLRGVRFIVNDTRAASVAAQAAIANPVASGRGLVPLPQVSVTNTMTPAASNPGPPARSAAAAAAANAAAIDALSAQLEALRTSLARDGNIQLGLQAARATATGIELVQLFDRPLAFGYQALRVRPAPNQLLPAEPGPAREGANTQNGLISLCERVP